MSGTENIFEILEAGLRVEGLRQRTISSNVANLQTPGYRRVDVKFKDALAKALSSGSNVDLREIAGEIFAPGVTPVKDNGNDVSLEVEVGEMVKNVLRHKTYIRLLQKKYLQMDLAINLR